jgi:Skp family chaperone for outer membrane proteins
MVFVVGLGLLAPAAAQEPPQIVVFDSSIVFDKSQQGEVLKAEIERLRDRKVQLISERQDGLAALQEEFRNKELTFNDDTRAEMLQAINQAQIELKRMNDDAQRELQAEFNRAQQKLQKQLIQVVEALGQEGNYTLIVEKGLTLYSSAEVEITDRVLVKFDEMYPSVPDSGGGP